MFIIDCDCHNYWCSATVLEPYLEGLWKDMFNRGERTGPLGAFPHGHRPWFHPEGFGRADVRPQTEDDNYLIMKEKHLDKYGIDIAIMTGDEPIEASTLANPHYAAALCRAYNDYQIDYWLPKDELPSFTPYLRSKYRDMPLEARKEIEQSFGEIAKKYGYDGSGPLPGEDET